MYAYDSRRPCHVIDNRCGACQACKNSRRMFAGVERGFTLIELMIVVAIIGILAAVVMPLFSKSNASQNYTPSGTVVDRVTAPQIELRCVNGLVFKVTPQGDVTPATDPQAQQLKCN